MPPVDPAADPSSDHADAGRDMSRALGGRLPPPSLAAAWAALAAAPADGQERLRSREERLLATPLGLLRWTGEREPSRVRCWEEVEEDGDGEAIAALPFLVNKFTVMSVRPRNTCQNRQLGCSLQSEFAQYLTGDGTHHYSAVPINVAKG